MKSVTRLFDLLELYRDEFKSKKDAFARKEDGKWKFFSSLDYCRYSELISLGLLAMGVKKGDRIATIMTNSPEWNFFDMGIMQVGAVQIPIYPTISAESYCYILNDAQVETIIVSNSTIYRHLKTVCREVPSIKNIFSIDCIRGVRNWEEILKAGRESKDAEELKRIRESIQPGDLASIIYTSGTTGRPKGVMLSHTNFISNFHGCAAIPDFKSSDRVLSFLPLCHVYERMLNYLFQSFGMSVYYAESLDMVADMVREVRPHTFAAVPRVIEKIYNRIVARGRNMNKPFRILFFWALRQGHKYELNGTNGWFYKIKLLAANVLIFSLWRRALGGRIKLIVAGGASLHPRLTRLFWAAGIKIIEGYGLTETSPVIAVGTLKKDGVKFGAVGKILPGVEVRIAADGEILCRGPNVMLGYYNRPERTREVIDPDGWFHTGDIGQLDKDGFLCITDRKKEIFKLSTGKYIAPQVIEQKLRESPFIEHIIVIGENRKYTAALIMPNFEYLRNWCEVKNILFISRENAVTNKRIIKRYQSEINRFNQLLGQTEKIKKFRLMPDVWSPETGELSITLKLRRKFIIEKYFRLIEDTYRSKDFDYRVDPE
jgi:long-chain acyl-CoA synthetase